MSTETLSTCEEDKSISHNEFISTLLLRTEIHLRTIEQREEYSKLNVDEHTFFVISEKYLKNKRYFYINK